MSNREEWDDRVPKPDSDGVRRYGQWAGKPGGWPEDPKNCIVQIYPGGRGAMHRQCSSRRGRGRDGLYCAHHDPDRLARIKRDLDAAEARKKAAANAIEREGRRLVRALGVSAYVEMRGAGYAERLVVPFASARKLVARLEGLAERAAASRERADVAAARRRS